MNSQELRKLRRSEMLEMMVRQGKSLTALQEQLSREKRKRSSTVTESQHLEETLQRLKRKLDQKDLEMARQAQQMEETFERLKAKLDEKDSIIEGLKEELEKEREKNEICLNQSGTMDAATARLNEIVDNAKKAIDQYTDIAVHIANYLE